MPTRRVSANFPAGKFLGRWGHQGHPGRLADVGRTSDLGYPKMRKPRRAGFVSREKARGVMVHPGACAARPPPSPLTLHASVSASPRPHAAASARCGCGRSPPSMAHAPDAHGFLTRGAVRRGALADGGSGQRAHHHVGIGQRLTLGQSFGGAQNGRFVRLERLAQVGPQLIGIARSSPNAASTGRGGRQRQIFCYCGLA